MSAYANKAYVTFNEGVARLAFGESAAMATESTYHTAVSMTVLDALALADAIYGVYDQLYPPTPPQGARAATAEETYGSPTQTQPNKPTGV
ncbi:MAG: hypothetical protein ACK4X1_01925 [Terricaulis sp.]